MQFFYIGKSYGSRKVEGDTFKAYRYKDKVTKKNYSLSYYTYKLV